MLLVTVIIISVVYGFIICDWVINRKTYDAIDKLSNYKDDETAEQLKMRLVRIKMKTR